MALEIKVGDLFNETLSTKCVIIHGCNAQGVMGSGVAKIVKDLFPLAYIVYKQAYKRHGLKLGNVVFWENHGNSPSIANAITQEFYGRDGKLYLSYDALVVALQGIKDKVGTETPIHMPLIGGGLGGGDEKRIRAIMQAVFHDCNATLWLQDE
jgi:O-acetyl-ADP-ribose deacetylase (regulator of RNase III)